MPHSFPQFGGAVIGSKAIERFGLAPYLAAQAAGIQHDNKGQAQSDAERRVLDALLERYQAGHAADNCAVIAGQSSIADQIEGQTSAAHAVDEKFAATGDQPGSKRRQQV